MAQNSQIRFLTGFILHLDCDRDQERHSIPATCEGPPPEKTSSARQLGRGFRRAATGRVTPPFSSRDVPRAQAETLAELSGIAGKNNCCVPLRRPGEFSPGSDSSFFLHGRRRDDEAGIPRAHLRYRDNRKWTNREGESLRARRAAPRGRGARLALLRRARRAAPAG